MLDLRLYRITLLPFAAVLIVVAFSLHPRPAALPTTPAAQTFDAATASAEMVKLAASYPERSPGSASDNALARALATTPSPGGLAGGAPAFRVRTVTAKVETTSGARTVTTVITASAGTGTGGGIALIADRGTSKQGVAGLSGTATLLELASIYKNLLTHRPLTLVSTSGGASAMSAVAAVLPANTEAAIVIGAVADAHGRGPYVVPWSSAGALAPMQLRRTVAAALGGTLPGAGGDVSLVDQLARLALPLTTGPQGPLEAAGVPAVLVSAAGEAAPTPGEAISAGRLGAFGQALLDVTGVLDTAPGLPSAAVRDLAIGTQVLSGWGVRLLVGALLLSLVGCTLDVLARGRRRGVAVGRWIGWVLGFAAPFVLTGLFVAFLGAGGLLPATPQAPVTPAQLPLAGRAVAAVVSTGLLFLLSWLLRAAARARSTHKGPPEPVGASAALLITATAVAALLWLANPYTAVLLILPLHLWLVVTTREHVVPPLVRAAYVLVSLAPLLAAIAVISSGLRVDPFALLWTLVLLIAGGGLSFGGLLLVALTAGCFVAAAVILLRGGASGPDERPAITVRGPIGYAGPGSLGGTESALRR